MSELQELSEIIADLKGPEEIEKFLTELLTESERKGIGLRWRLMDMLFRGVPQRKISSDLGISLCKITRGSKIVQDKDSIARAILLSQSGADNQ